MTLLISHRGNLSGTNPKEENRPSYIKEALDAGFDVEVDVWILGQFNVIALGHDKPEYIVEQNFLVENRDKFWLHCKNLEALLVFSEGGFRAFYHQNDDFTLTTNGLIWTYPGKNLTPRSIVVLQTATLGKYSEEMLKNCYGICSDHVLELKDMKL